jgi:uncharacterized protein (TIGR03086 family)
MSDIAERYRRLAAGFADTIRQVPADRWSDPSPCAGWTARDVVGHLVDVHGIFLGLVGRELRPGPAPAADPLGAFTAASAQVQADLDDPGRAGAGFDGYFGRSTFAEAVDRFVCFDLLVHRWDLSRAAGLDERVDAAELPRLWQDVEVFGDAIRSEGTCGPAVEPPADADEQTRLLCYLGRRP